MWATFNYLIKLRLYNLKRKLNCGILLFFSLSLSLVPSHYLSLSNNHIATISLCLCLTRLISLSFYHTTFALYLQVIRIYHFLPLCPTHFLYLSITLLFFLSFLHTTLLLSSSQSTLDLFVSNSNLSFLHSVFILVY